MDKKIEKLFVAVKAFIVKDGKVLILSESRKKDTGTNPGKFDFPGGKIERGEKPEMALFREVREEIGLKIEIIKPFHIEEWQPVVHGEQWQIVGVYYECRLKDNEAPVQISHEHSSFEWIEIKDYDKYDLMDQPRKAFEKKIAI